MSGAANPLPNPPPSGERGQAAQGSTSLATHTTQSPPPTDSDKQAGRVREGAGPSPTRPNG